MTRQTVSLEEIKDRLLAQVDAVQARYAPEAPGSYRKGHLFFTLNPGRADRSVGSFCLHLSGPKAGRWYDYATAPRGGDLLDLIGMSCNLSATDAIKEARAFLGLDTETPELKRIRDEAAAIARARRKAEEAQIAERAAEKAKWAEGLWLSAQEKIAGTPVDYYLKGRGIDLAQLGHQPRAIRYHPQCHYLDEITDPETGEVTTQRLKMPAMVTAISRGAKTVACHRTYLATGPDGTWTKANVPDAKKVLGSYAGGSIRLSSGIGPRGGKAAPLADCPPGTRVYIAEGIETALSAVILRPEARVLAAGSLFNLSQIELPANVAEVVLISDHDPSPKNQAAFKAAIEAHAAKGRRVRVWQSERPGEDLNDALKRALKERGAA